MGNRLANGMQLGLIVNHMLNWNNHVVSIVVQVESIMPSISIMSASFEMCRTFYFGSFREMYYLQYVRYYTYRHLQKCL
ncbi:hypothetical protein Trydic_g2257 [Trypoxylus dichotomus]